MIRSLVKFVVILGLVCVFIGGGVAGLYGYFKKHIDDREDQAKQKAILEVCPEGASVDIEHPLAGDPFASDAVYAARDADGKIVGYVAAGEAQGYSSVIRVMAGVVLNGNDFKVHRVVVLSQQETPGLGANVAEEKSNFTLWEKIFGPSEPGKTERLINPFLDRFRGKKEGKIEEIHGITAATITSNATKAAVRRAIERIRAAVKKHNERATA